MIRSMFRGKTWLLALAVGCAAATTTSAGPIPARTGEEDLGRLVAGPGQTADESRARLLREANALQQHMIFLRQHILALEKSARELDILAADAERENRLTSAASFRETARQFRQEIRETQNELMQVQTRLVEIERQLRDGSATPDLAPPLHAKAASAVPPPPLNAANPHDEALKEFRGVLTTLAGELESIGSGPVTRAHIVNLRKLAVRFEQLRTRFEKLPVPSAELSQTLIRTHKKPLGEVIDRIEKQYERFMADRVPAELVPAELREDFDLAMWQVEEAAVSVLRILESWPK